MSITSLHHPSHHRTWIEVDLSAIRHNLRMYQELVGPNTRVMPCLKADAYGHGAVAVAQTLLDGGVTRLVVATCQEGEELRAAGITAPIHILGAPLPEEIPHAFDHDLYLNIHQLEVAELISLEAVKRQRIVKVHLKIDTGMGRLGILPENTVAAANRIAQLPGIELEGVFMHFADANDEGYCQTQLRSFFDALERLEAAGIHIPIKHAASSSASILYPESRFDMIRPGAGLYGYLNPPWLRNRFPLRPALSWKCVVVQLKDYPEGSSLGYNRTFTTRRPTRVAVLPVGYADGYIRTFSNSAEVLIHGRRAPVVGMISMDYTMIDVTGMDDVTIGSEVTLIGQDGDDRITVEELAGKGGTTPYVITTCLGRRPGRCYVE